MNSYVKQRAAELEPWMIELRREFHRRPELAFQEHDTACLVSETLASLGLETVTGVAGTGVIGDLAQSPGPAIGIRAELDALPVNERTGLPFSSARAGLMHACGHDGHLAIALGAAAILSGCRERLNGTVRFIFQPAEEAAGGAEAVIRSPAYGRLPPDAIIGFHLWPQLGVGQIGLRYGTMTAASDDVRIVISGQGGHGARPHQGVDAVVAAAHTIVMLQTVVSREIDPAEPVVLTIGRIQGSQANNILAGEVELGGTVRTINERTRREMPEIIERIVQGTTSALRARARIEYLPGTGPVVNDPELTRVVEAAVRQVAGPANVVHLEAPSMGSDDFAAYLRSVPGVYFRIGARQPDAAGENVDLHHPAFDFDERALALGAAVLAQTVINYLESRLEGGTER